MVKIDEGYDYKYYVCNSKGKLVMGFDDEKEAYVYADVNHYRIISKENLEKKNISPFNIDNWTVNFPEKGLY